MCERRAANLGTDLPRFFWDTLPEWKNYYFYQLRLAHSLVKRYNGGILIRALNELKYIYSLNVKKLKTLLEQIEKEPKLLVEEIDKPLESSLPSGVFYRKKGKLGQLDE